MVPQVQSGNMVRRCRQTLPRVLLTYGDAAVQLAKLAGFSPIITTASLHNTEFIRSLGATHVLDRKLSLEELREEVRNITTQPVDVIFDAISLPDTQLSAYELLAPGGTLVLVLFPAIPKERLRPDRRLAKAFGQANYPEVNRVAARKLYGKLTTWLSKGYIKVGTRSQTCWALLIGDAAESC